MIDRKDWPEDARNAQAAFDEASWDAVEAYRDTGEMVPGMDYAVVVDLEGHALGMFTGKQVLPSTVKEIGQWAFRDCTRLNEIVVPKEVKAQVHSAAFTDSPVQRKWRMLPGLKEQND